VPALRLSRAMNVVVRQVAGSHACGGVVDGRFLFLVPWRDVSILGTSHDTHEGGPDALTVTGADLEAFLADGRRAFPGARLDRSDVRLVHRGLLPMVSGEGARVKLLRESAVVDHAAHGAPGLVSIHGVRYTTARHTAEEAVNAVFRGLGHSTPPPCHTDHSPLWGGGISSVAAFVKNAVDAGESPVPPDTLARLAATYGTEYPRVLNIAREAPALGAAIGRTTHVTGAEIVHAARHEMAVTLADAVIRRTEAGSAGHPGADALQRAAALMAWVHGWDARQMEEEIEAVEAFYRLPE
jgi:glycerol-3-phosphate dehydrogenase